MRGVFLLVSFGSPKRSWNRLPNSYERRSPSKTRLTLRSPSMVEKNVPKKKGPIFWKTTASLHFKPTINTKKHDVFLIIEIQLLNCHCLLSVNGSRFPRCPITRCGWGEISLWVSIKFGISVEFFNCVTLKGDTFCALYKDLSRGHPKWWFSKAQADPLEHIGKVVV